MEKNGKMKIAFYHYSFIISHFIILEMKIASEGDKNDDVIISGVEGGVIKLQEGEGQVCHNSVRQVS